MFNHLGGGGCCFFFLHMHDNADKGVSDDRALLLL